MAGPRSLRRAGAAAGCAALLLAVVAPGAGVGVGGLADGAGRQAANTTFRASLISACVAVREPARTPALSFDGARLPFELATGRGARQPPALPATTSCACCACRR